MYYGLLGRKLDHSYSPQIHSYLGNYTYQLLEKEPEEVSDFLKHGDFSGLNVTIPYKKTVLPYCDILTDTAKEMGAVNTIVRRKDGALIGHNTDYFGFLSMIDRSGLKVEGKKVLVLGSGGASNAAVQVLKKMNANVKVISRTGENNYHNLHLHADCAVLVNATPVGMYPNNGISPVDLDCFPILEGVLDLIYNPARTKLLLDAEKRGIIAQNGLWMLVAQAKESAEMFTGKPIPNNLIEKIHNTLSKQMKNIVLIGMPGCGKTTVATHLAQLLGRQALDADAEVVKAAGCSIPEIFARGGETEFRRIETEVLTRLGKLSGAVISTGGGCVTKPENYPLVHQNSVIVWLQRDIQTLSTEGRPLSLSIGLETLQKQREPLYSQFADMIVENNCSPAETAENIRRQL